MHIFLNKNCAFFLNKTGYIFQCELFVGPCFFGVFPPYKILNILLFSKYTRTQSDFSRVSSREYNICIKGRRRVRAIFSDS